jgi:two-component system, chemotaxis family, CheB/CheR fusion protein
VVATKRKPTAHGDIPAAPSEPPPAGGDLESPVPAVSDDLFPVVGIGASAGGLEAFTALVSSLTDAAGMAYVVVSHLDPVHPSALSEILARATSIPVIEISDGQVIAPDTIYVLPPGRDVTIEDSRLLLQPRGGGALHRPIDLFLRSLADARRHQAIGVVLSGTATDGTLGVRAIKGAGGITFAQDDSARQTSMPHSAIADGFVDFVMAPHEIGAELVRIGRSPRTLEDAELPQVDEEAQVTDVLRSVRRETGVDFTHYKAGTLRRRILRRMILTRAQRLHDYAQTLRVTPGEARALHDDLLIGVTSFFRDPASFEALARTAFRRVLDSSREGEPIRIWVLGCSTGEEAYSLAIALTEYAEAAGTSAPLQIFASDVNAAGIEVARAGAYPADIAADVSAARLARFFVKIDDHYRVVKSIRDACIFSRHNVLTDPPFSRIDFVSCRNLLMYLESVLQHDVIGNLHYSLRPDGVLWLGPADTVAGHHDLFDPLDAQHKIFGRRPGSVSHPVLPTLASRLRGGDRAARPGPPSGTLDLVKESDRVLLHRFAPAAVVASASLEIRQYRGDVGRYVSPTPGKASLDLMQVLDRRLHVAVRAAITKARREGIAVRDEDVLLAATDGERARGVSVEVVPVGVGPEGFLILFEDVERTPPHVSEPTSSASPSPTEAQSSLASVTRELAATQAYLQSIIDEQETARQDLEAAHEEAQSANEELQSINEELETSKEEIQSANEELTTLNDELQHRNADLQLTNNDLVNLLASTDLAVVFVGPQLGIRRFTAAAARLLNLRPADVGRPLSDLRIKLDVDVEAQVARTLHTLETGEQNAQSADGRWFSLRTRPYRTLDNQIDGAVLVLVDIDDVVRARLYAESIVATGRAPSVVLDERLAVVTANDAFLRVFETRATEVEGRSFFELRDRQWDLPQLRRLLEQVVPQDHVVRDFEVAIEGHGSHRTWLLDARRLHQADGHRPLILLSMEDVSERHHAEGLREQRVAELALADRSKNEFLAMLAHELRNPLAPIRTAAQMLGIPGVPPAAASQARVIIERQIRNMVRLIDDLLDVARITQGKLTLQLAPLELTSVLRRAAEVVDRHVQERGQGVSLSFEADAVYVLGDTTRLEQAFGNLLNNASKFSKQGGRIHVRMRAAARAQGVFVHISDEGVGIDASTLPHVFELFKQGSPSPHHASGLGVGLALVRRIVELHGGRITASSAGVGQGSEFVVSLPVLANGALDAEQIATHLMPTSEARRILVVDDNVDAAESLTTLLRVYGHDARMVHDGPAALELAPSFLPSVVFLDIGMPGMDGYEVARRLRQMPGGQDALLVAVTGFGREEDRQRSQEAGFDRHVTKPLDPGMLSSLISASTDARDPSE